MNPRWILAVSWLAVFSGGTVLARATEVLYAEDFDGPGVKAGQSVLDTPLGWRLVGPNDPAKNSVGNVFLGAGKYGWAGNYLDGGTATAANAKNCFSKAFPAIPSGKVVLSCRAFAPGKMSVGSGVGLCPSQSRFFNRGGGWISTTSGWEFWVGRADSSTYPLGTRKLGPYQVLKEPLLDAHDVTVDLRMTVDLDQNKAWGEAHWKDAQGHARAFKTAVYDWDSAGGNVANVLVTIDKHGGHTGIAVDDLRVEGVLPMPKPYPFGQQEHVVLHLNGEKESVSLPAEMQWISKPWNGENAQMPYLVYMPEKDRLLMLVECRQPIQSALIASDDHGATWSPRRWLAVDNAGQPNATALGLTYLGQGRLLAFPEDLKVHWLSADYGQTWERSEPKTPPEGYSWDPLLVIPNTDGRVERVVHAYWGLTESRDHAQGYLRFSLDEGRTWNDAVKVPQWLGCGEINILVAKNGDWVAAGRTDPPKRFAAHSDDDNYCGLVVSVSKDKGKTWSPVKMLYEWGRHHPSMVLLPDGKIVMTYVVRYGYPNTADGFPQFGVEAVVSPDNGQTWGLEHRYILAKWVGNLKGEDFRFCSVQSTSTVLLPDGTILTAFGTGFRNASGAEVWLMNVAIVKWRVSPQVSGTDK